MAYLGRNLANLSDRVVLDSLTASATASYTLQLNSVNFVPSSAESLTVSLNGVIQAPISSYTVSGSTLTFASALTSSDSIDFIIAERGITLQTPSAGSVGTSQLANDAVTKDKVSNLMYPAFEAYLSADQDITESVDTKVQFDTEVFDTDNCYDNTTNYRFTPTVAGKYFVYLFIRGDSKDVSKLDFLFSRLYKNGSIYRESLIDLRNNFGRQATTSISTVVNMNGTTDYLEGFLRVDTQATTPKAESNNKSCYFGAYRIGD
jgi:hypothetical protein